MKTLLSLWLDFQDEAERVFCDELDQFPLNLIQSPRKGPQAKNRAKQQSLQIAQSILLTAALCELEPSLNDPLQRQWLVKSSQPTCGRIFEFVFCGCEPSLCDPGLLKDKLVASFERSQRSGSRIDMTEVVLSLTGSGSKKTTGVYYTPAEVARFLIERVDQSLKKNGRFTSGLACATPNESCNIFDPAVGAGVFWIELVKYFHRIHSDTASSANCWTESLLNNILPRMFGCDVLLPSLVATHLNLAATLHKTGFDFDKAVNADDRLNLVLANSLDDLSTDEFINRDREGIHTASREAEFTRQILREFSMHAVVGNPPFFSLSQNDGSWIRSLVTGLTGDNDTDREPVANYLEVDGERLRERKVWLHDDYVKFFRYAQWLIEQSGSGAIGFVSNRGFINNVTFRGMRNCLLRHFGEIELVDLQGDSRNRDSRNRDSRNRDPSVRSKSPVEKDENIFPIETGVAIAILSRSTDDRRDCAIRYASIRGRAKAKINRLVNGLNESDFQRLKPTEPNFFFDPRDANLRVEYETGWRICDVMPQFWSVPVTARDHFVIDVSREKLLMRVKHFCDESISDDEIRRRYFSRTRSNRYQPGDSRGWNMSETRAKLAKQETASLIRRVNYRPFDHRWIFWSPDMIDWPRSGLAEQFSIPGNLALIARRQSPPESEANFFYVTDTLAIDGILRSDNRGNESLFPLFIRDPDGNGSGEGELKANFTGEFISSARDRWQQHIQHVDEQTFAKHLFSYIYALFHSSEYRQRFSQEIGIDFPRVFLCEKSSLASQLSECGHRLIACHLNKTAGLSETVSVSHAQRKQPDAIEIRSGFPRFDESRILLNEACAITDVSPEVWSYRFGKHQVARKWLKDRRKHPLSEADLRDYRAVLAAIRQTIAIQRNIDTLIAANGAWQTAFHCETNHH